MNRQQFVAAYGGIYEHSPWVAERAWDKAAGGGEPDVLASPQALAAGLAAEVDAASRAEQLALIRAHPDLAGRAAIAGELTEHSRGEQSGAGLDRCTPEEFAAFQTLNAAYTARFGFPFVIAVKGLGRTEILAAFRRRLHHSPEAEFAEALTQIHKIARLRLAAM